MAGMTDTIGCANCEATVPWMAVVCPLCGGNPRAMRAAVVVREPELAASAEPDASPGLTLMLPNWEQVEIPQDGQLDIGRESGIDVVDQILAAYVDVSRQHAVLAHSGTGILVTDLDTPYGTWVDDTRLAPFQPTPIEPGQRLRLGGSCYLKVMVHGG